MSSSYYQTLSEREFVQWFSDSKIIIVQKSSVYLWDKMVVILSEVLKEFCKNLFTSSLVTNISDGLARAWMSVVSVVCFQVDVSSMGRSLVQISPTKCCVSECDREASVMRRSWPTSGCCVTGGKRMRTAYKTDKCRKEKSSGVRSFRSCWIK